MSTAHAALSASRTLRAEPTKEHGNRRRSSSLVQVIEPSTFDELQDQGAWSIHIVMILLAKIFYNTLPGVSQELGWTLTNLSYMAASYLMFHYVRGVPFDFNSGAFDQLNMWEQMDNGVQYTPAKKFLTAVPIVLFLLSTHYTHYDFTMFIVNLWALLMVLIPKLPFAHRLRIFGVNKFDLKVADE
ncbi:protein ORM1 [Protomyces lactucae-debilis]|uniref:Protein ORM1 n=1 Tax=Protomyces lactucae-debilis TaxID=2754530 RepID=A0A1Y2FJQ8_PROLT|nr:protein ORM1 [Protomyces lactucae-debilis]ORY83827.1 protein ORM1 [Protomyces lactucae-debilis]